MNARLAYLVTRVRESFWIVPTLITLVMALLAGATGAMDRGVLGAVIEDFAPVVLRVDNARSILATIAGSMITVVSLVFSLTIIALTLAAQQLGPRLVPLFVRDRLTQVVLGAFLGTFVYALLSLATLGANDSAVAQATATVALAITLALGSVALLVGFIHHLAHSIQADIVIARVSAELVAQIEERLSPRGGADGTDPSTEREATRPDGAGHAVVAVESGYIQSIDYASLVACAMDDDAVIDVRFRPGQFVCAGEALAVVHAGQRELDGAVRSAVAMGPKRTGTDDVEFALQAIVEIGLRALSPGVNDPFTALTCVDRIGDALARVLERCPPAPLHRDREGMVRVFAEAVTLDGIFDAAFNQLRQAGERDVAVLIRLAETLVRLARHVQGDAERGVLRRHAQMLGRAGAHAIREENDRADLERRLRAFDAVLAGE